MIRELRQNPSRGRYGVIATGLAFLLTMEFLRAWAVSMPLFFQGYLRMSEVTLGILVFSPFLIALLAAAVFTRLHAPALVLVAAAALSRVVLQFVGGGVPHMVLTLVGLSACLILLATNAPRRLVVPGLVIGLAGDAVLLMVLKTESLVFRNGPLAAAAMVVVVGAFALFNWRFRAPRGAGIRAAVRSRSSIGSLLVWVALGPALALHLTLASLPAPLEIATGWETGVTRGVVLISYAVAGLLAWYVMGRSHAGRVERTAPALTALVCVSAAFAGLVVGSSGWRLVTSVTLPMGLVIGLASLSHVGGLCRPVFVRLSAVVAIILGVSVPFFYYLGYVVLYTFAREWLLVGAACFFGALLALGASMLFAGRRRSGLTQEGPAVTTPPPPVPGSLRLNWRSAAIAIGVFLLLLGPGISYATPVAKHVPPTAFPVRVASYNIFMGLGGDVNMDLDRLAGQIAAQNPDVIALQEVSRGWFMSGSVDLLPRLANRLGYSYHFFPAAGEVWGNAILTNLPSAEYAYGSLPRGVAAMQRGWGGAVLQISEDQRLLVVVSHLHHPHDGGSLRSQQAEVLVSDTLSLADRHRVLPMTVLVGDLNAEADSAELSPLRSWFWDVLGHISDPLATYPSWAPKQRIDHIFASDGLHATDPAVFGGLASDHLGIVVSLSPVLEGETPTYVRSEEPVEAVVEENTVEAEPSLGDPDPIIK